MNNTDELKDNQGLFEDQAKPTTESIFETTGYEPGVHHFNRPVNMVQMTRCGGCCAVKVESYKQRHFAIIIKIQYDPPVGGKN